MSTLLSLTITFLDDRFHGQGDRGPEWPPSPHRLYQAMLCAAARNHGDAEEEFRWFETLGPPEILSPQTTPAPTIEMFVPNNDADVPSKYARQNRLTSKTMSPLRMQGDSTTVRYLWSVRQEDVSMAERIVQHVRRITAVGWGINLVVADAQVIDAENPQWQNGMVQWLPASSGPNILRCPVPGTLDDLREVYQSFLDRVDGKFYQAPRRPTAFREVAYRATGDTVLSRPYVAFNLLRPNDDSGRSASFDQRRAVHLAEWVRGRACLLSDPEKGGRFLDGYDSNVYVRGYVSEEAKRGPSPPRFSYLPIPSIGHDHVDGRIRRFIVAGPYGGEYAPIGWAKQNLNLQILTDNSHQSQATLELARNDTVIGRYINGGRTPSKTFRTVTPVFLTGHDDRNYRKTEKMLLKAIEQAGFSLENIDDLFLQKAPFFPGAYHPRDYCLPKYIKQHHSSIHVRIAWKHTVRGPLAIGAGRYLGLGLFATIGEGTTDL